MNPKVVELSNSYWLKKKITSSPCAQAFYYFLCAGVQKHSFILFSEGLLTFTWTSVEWERYYLMGFWSEPFPPRMSFVGKHWMGEKSSLPPSNHLGIVLPWSLFSLQRKQAWNTTTVQRSTMASAFQAVCKVTATKNSSPKMLPHEPEVFRRL